MNTAPGYAAIGIYRPGQTQPSLMSADGKIIVFDTPQMAKEFLPQLGGGRLCHWDSEGETAGFTPIEPGKVNRVCIVTKYDPYNLPAGMPVLSETRSKEWKSHLHWGQWLQGQQ